MSTKRVLFQNSFSFRTYFNANTVQPFEPRKSIGNKVIYLANASKSLINEYKIAITKINSLEKLIWVAKCSLLCLVSHDWTFTWFGWVCCGIGPIQLQKIPTTTTTLILYVGRNVSNSRWTTRKLPCFAWLSNSTIQFNAKLAHGHQINCDRNLCNWKYVRFPFVCISLSLSLSMCLCVFLIWFGLVMRRANDLQTIDAGSVENWIDLALKRANRQVRRFKMHTSSLAMSYISMRIHYQFLVHCRV